MTCLGEIDADYRLLFIVFDIKFLDLPVNRPAADTQESGRLGLVPGSPVQRFNDNLGTVDIPVV